MKQLINYSVILVFLLLSACQSGVQTSDSGVKHFRKIRFSETPFDQITGLHALTSEEAKSINNYKFSYNEEGRAISVEFCRGDELLAGSQTGASKIQITWEGNKELHHYFDKNGKSINRAGFHTAEYTLDENGVRKGLRFLDREGNNVENRNGIAWIEWIVLASNQVKENRYTLEGEETVLNEFCPFYELRFTYDKDGFVTRMANYQGDSMYNCTVENCGDIGVSYFAFQYNEAGDLTEFVVNALNGQLSNLYWGWAKIVNEHDKNGNVIESSRFDQDNEPYGGMNIPVTQLVYDDHGSVIERKFMDIERNILNHPRSGIAVTKYGYTDAGHPKDTLNFNSEMLEI